MRHGSSNNRRQRNRNNRRPNNGPGKSFVYDSNGPDVRIRGTAHQISEKYQALAKDSASAGDHMMYENYLQHAEHYLRIIASHSTANEAAPKRHTREDDADGNNESSDLSLPSSIVGDKAKVASKEATPETV